MLPSRVTVGGHEFAVDVVERVSKQADLRGEIDHLNGNIRIMQEMVDSRKEECLLHEVFHEIEQQAHLGLEERDIWTISEGFYAFIKQNPHWITFRGAGAERTVG